VVEDPHHAWIGKTTLAVLGVSFNCLIACITECKGLAISLVVDTSWSSTSSNGVVQDTATKMAIGSIEKKSKFLGAKTQRCSWKASASTSPRVVAAVNEEACLELMAFELQTDARTKFPPTLVVCNSIPAAKAMRDRWAENPLNKNAVIEYTALPCSMKQLVRAIESVLKSKENLSYSSHPEPVQKDAQLRTAKTTLPMMTIRRARLPYAAFRTSNR